RLASVRSARALDFSRPRVTRRRSARSVVGNAWRYTRQCARRQKAMKSFCTYFDRNYLVRGLTMYRSLEEHAAPFTLYVLCLDEYTCEKLHKLNRPSLVPISLAEFEAGDTALLEAKKKRSAVEYFFT